MIIAIGIDYIHYCDGQDSAKIATTKFLKYKYKFYSPFIKSFLIV